MYYRRQLRCHRYLRREMDDALMIMMKSNILTRKETVIAVMWQIFTGLFASSLITGRMDASPFREINNIWCECMILVFIMSILQLGRGLTNVGCFTAPARLLKQQRGPLWGLQASTCILIGHSHARPNVLWWGEGHFLKASPPCKYSMSPMTLFTVKNS